MTAAGPAAEAEATRGGFRQALASPNFRALLSARLVSTSGTSIAAVALTVLVYGRTASPLLASLAFALTFLPYLFGGALLSGVVDRVRPRQLATGCDAISAVLAAAMALPRLPVAIPLGLLFGIGSLSAVSSGAVADLVRSTVPYGAYVPARSLLRLAAQFAQIGGNAAGGLLVAVVKPDGAMLINAVSFAFSSITVWLAVGDHPNTGQTSRARVLRDSLHGARQVFARYSLLRLLLFGWLTPMFAVVPEAVAAPYVTAHHGSSTWVGWWLVAMPLGVIVANIAGVRLLTARQQHRLVAPVAVTSFVPYLAFTFNPPIPIAMALLLVSGICNLYMLGLDGRVRDAAPDHLFARTMTLNLAGVVTAQGIGFTLGGAAAQGLGPGDAILAAGICGIAVTVALLGRGLPVIGALRPSRR